MKQESGLSVDVKTGLSSKELAEMIERFCTGKMEIKVVNADNREVEI